MTSRILISTLAAAALWATPALASESPKSADATRPHACDCAAMHEHHQARDLRGGAAARKEEANRTAPAQATAGPGAFSSTPSYWTGP